MERERRDPGNRLFGLGEAGLRLSESLDLGRVLQPVVDGARSLTGASYGAFVLLDGAGGGGVVRVLGRCRGAVAAPATAIMRRGHRQAPV